MAKRIKLYALSTCGWCKKTHFFMEENNISHEVIAVDLLSEKNKESVRTEIKQYNPRITYPTVIIDDTEAIIGYDEEKLKMLVSNG